MGDKTRHLLESQLRYSTLFLLGAMGGVLINLDWLVDLLANEAYSHSKVYLLFAPYPALVILMYLGQQVLLLEKKIRLVSISYAAGLMANIGGNLLLIPALGIFGAIISTLTALVIIIFIQSLHFSPLRHVSGALVAMVAIQVGVLGALLYTSLPLLFENFLFAIELTLVAIFLRLIDLSAVRRLVIWT